MRRNSSDRDRPILVFPRIARGKSAGGTILRKLAASEEVGVQCAVCPRSRDRRKPDESLVVLRWVF
jgi:hypothetical protein